MRFGNIDLQKLGELQNAKMQNLASTPTSPVESQFWYDTANHVPMYYNGTTAKQFGLEYIFSTGLTENISTHTVTLNLASTVTLGGVIIGSNINVANDGTISVSDASTSTKGVIEIATDAEATTGTDTSRAVTPKQLATKVTANTAITGATKTKITYDAKGLVTGGADLQASDIPNLTLSKITDVTATASEVNVLDGITASTAELNIMDGVIVTAADINSVTNKIGLSALSIDSGSTNYLGYDSATGKFSAKVDTTVTDSSSKLVTSGAVASAIANAITGGMVYKGVWTATGQTDYSSITLPVKAGYMYLVSGSATIGGIEWNTDDYLVINADVAVGGTITDVKKIDNTEGSDIVRLNASQTLTNKTIDADDNTISDLGTSNFKSGVVRTSTDGIRGVSSASDTSIVTEKAIAAVLASRTYSEQNPALTVSGGSGICIWTITHNMNNSNVGIHVYEVSTGDEVMYDRSITSANVVTVKILADANIAADTYKVVILG